MFLRNRAFFMRPYYVLKVITLLVKVESRNLGWIHFIAKLFVPSFKFIRIILELQQKTGQ